MISLAMFLTAACQATERPHSSNDLAAIRALDDGYVEAVLAQDWSGLASLFKADAVLMPPNESMVVGRDAILARGEAFQFAAVDYAHQESDIGGVSGVAYLQGTYTISVVLPDEAGARVDHGKYLWVLEKQSDGVWLIEKVMWNSDVPIPPSD